MATAEGGTRVTSVEVDREYCGLTVLRRLDTSIGTSAAREGESAALELNRLARYAACGEAYRLRLLVVLSLALAAGALLATAGTHHGAGGR